MGMAQQDLLKPVIRFTGGRRIAIKGRPSNRITALGLPAHLSLPLSTRRFSFSKVLVARDQRVSCGDALAIDPANHGVPLLAPCGGTVKLKPKTGVIILENLSADTTPARQVPLEKGARLQALVTMGAWQFLADAYTGRLPDPERDPSAAIVSTVNFDPFCARGDAQLKNGFDDFTAGLGHLANLLGQRPLYVIIPAKRAPLAERLRAAVQGTAAVVEVPMRCGLEKPALLARHLGLKFDREMPVWAMEAAGVLAVSRVLSHFLPVTDRVIAVGGPCVAEPEHVRLVPGYPIGQLLDSHAAGVSRENLIAVNGGILTGIIVQSMEKGIDNECAGITVVERPHSGDPNRHAPHACISCNACEPVCPAGIMPQVLHKLIYQDSVEDADKMGIALCVGCGLCAFVCPSRIDLSKEIVTYQERVRKELYAA